jgi:hypothetical protein
MCYIFTNVCTSKNGPFLVPQQGDLFSNPRLPNLATQQWQIRRTNRNLDKRGHLPKLGINQCSHEAENAPNQEEPARKNQEEIVGTGTAREGYRPHTSRDSPRYPPEGVIVVGTTKGVSLST